ncbi:MAG: ABC transporter permease [Treponema sp. GWB1_62_6]|nr:MAG: ABC transporter permease [Treponema sp. GWC1_61_84]OHE67356.1 MAG: ABC transporter permease [Treponema sp. GWB1_62_6]OHE75130.1 MAG: ABC transporter permease [Treponema sp. RIFOXYC1_FULL_61_9]
MIRESPERPSAGVRKAPSRFLEKSGNMLVSLFTNPYNVISLVSLVLLAYLIVVPVGEMVRTSFTWQPKDARLVETAVPGAFTAYHWVQMLSSEVSRAMLWEPLLNSLAVALWVSAISLVIGGLMAWVTTRTDLPGRKFFAFCVLVPYMLPSWYKALAWIAVFKNERIGGYPGFLNAIFGWSPPDWLSYGFLPIVITLSIHYYAFAYLLISSALSSIGGDLEEMGEIAGASRFTILRKITFPLVLPAILSSFILTFSRAIGTFGVPAFLGLKVNYYTISTMLFASVRNRQTVQAYILSIVLIFLAVLTVYMNQKMIGKRKSYTTIGGKGTRKNLVKLGKWTNPILSALILFIVVAVIFPVVILLLQSFLERDGIYKPDNLTLHYWIGESTRLIGEGEPGIFRNGAMWRALGTTMKLVLVSSVIATFVGLILGYVISRGRKKLSGRVIEQVSFLPYLIPSIAFGAIYLSMFSRPHFFIPVLYGTLAILILISVVKYLPFSVRAGTSNMMQIGSELEEAAMIEGASFARRFFRIVMPLAGKGFVSGFILIFISAMKELDLVVLLMTPATSTLTALTYSYADSGFHQFSDAVITVIVAIIMVVYVLAGKIGKVDMSKGLGG